MRFPGVEVAKRQGQALVVKVKTLVIKTPAQYTLWDDELAKVNGRIKAITLKIEPKVNTAFKLHKDLVALRDEALAPWVHAKKVIGGAIGTYTLEQRRKQEALQQQMEREAKGRAAQDRKDEIAKAQKDGDRQTVRELKQAPLTVPVVVAPPLVPTGHATVQERISYEIIEPDAVPREFCDPSPRKLQARVQQAGLSAVIPGVRVFMKPVVSGGSA